MRFYWVPNVLVLIVSKEAPLDEVAGLLRWLVYDVKYGGVS